MFFACSVEVTCTGIVNKRGDSMPNKLLNTCESSREGAHGEDA
jgi:hypothetical protein